MKPRRLILAVRRVVGSPWRAALTIGSRLAFERDQLSTSRHVSLQSYGLGGSGRVDYAPSGWLFLRRMMRGLTPTHEDVFIDLGSGMGRMVNMAARRYPFKRVIGVEISQDLNAIAMENARRLHDSFRCKDVQFVTADATTYEVPDDVTFVYFFNPFVDEAFNTVLGNLCRSLDRRPRRLHILYANPVMAAAILATGRFELVRFSKGIRRDIRLYRIAVFVTADHAQPL